MVTVSVQLCPSQIRSVSRGSTSTTMRFKFFFSNHCTGLLFLTLKTFFIVHAKGEMTEEHNRPVMVRKFRNFWCCYKLLSYSTYHVNVALHNLNNSAKTWSVLPGGGAAVTRGRVVLQGLKSRWFQTAALCVQSIYEQDSEHEIVPDAALCVSAGIKRLPFWRASSELLSPECINAHVSGWILAYKVHLEVELPI